MVVLDQHEVAQRAPVVHAAAGPHRGLLQRPQPGGRLAGVPDAGPAVGRPHEPPGEGGHARQVAQEVQRGALGGEDRGQRPVDPAQHLAGPDLGAVVGGPVQLGRRVDLAEGLAHAAAAGDHALLAGHEGGPGPGPFRHQAGGEVAQRADVLGQRPGDGLPDRGDGGMNDVAHDRSVRTSGAGTARSDTTATAVVVVMASNRR